MKMNKYRKGMNWKIRLFEIKNGKALKNWLKKKKKGAIDTFKIDLLKLWKMLRKNENKWKKKGS